MSTTRWEACSPEITCNVNELAGPLCRQMDEVVSPRLLAEEVCPNALQSAWETLQNNPLPSGCSLKMVNKRLYEEGSWLLEMALRMGEHDIETAEELFQGSMGKFKQAASAQTEVPPLKPNLFVAYEECFDARLRGSDPTEGLLATRSNLANLAQSRVLSSNLFDIGHHLWEGHFGRILFPATSRENESPESLQSERHGSYVIEEQEDGSWKSAFVDGQSPGPRVQSVAFGRWALESVQRMGAFSHLHAGAPRARASQAGKLVVEWLCQEVAGYELPKWQHEILEDMYTTGYVPMPKHRLERGLQQNLGNRLPDHLRQ